MSSARGTHKAQYHCADCGAFLGNRPGEEYRFKSGYIINQPWLNRKLSEMGESTAVENLDQSCPDCGHDGFQAIYLKGNSDLRTEAHCVVCGYNASDIDIRPDMRQVYADEVRDAIHPSEKREKELEQAVDEYHEALDQWEETLDEAEEALADGGAS